MSKRKQNIVIFRNPLHNHPLLRKGTVHEKSNKAKRRKEKMNLRRECSSLIELVVTLFEKVIHYWITSTDRATCCQS